MRCLWATVLVLALAGGAGAQPREVTVTPSITFVERSGSNLVGDFYQPKGLDKAPVLVAVHGGGWQAGNRAFYKEWGSYLAKNGYAVFAVSYRLAKPGVSAYPGAAQDVKAAVQFVRANAERFNIDPARIALIGDSAGAHLSALVALAGDEPTLAGDARQDPHATTPAAVKAVIGFYGVFDMKAQWDHDQIARPRNQITEQFLGASPMVNRRVFFDASPISYATVGKNEAVRTRFLLIHGTNDNIVDPTSQSQAFLVALSQAGFFVRAIVVPGSGHFWSVDPVEEPGSYGAQVAPQVLRFLAGAL